MDGSLSQNNDEESIFFTSLGTLPRRLLDSRQKDRPSSARECSLRLDDSSGHHHEAGTVALLDETATELVGGFERARLLLSELARRICSRLFYSFSPCIPTSLMVPETKEPHSKVK